MATQQDGGWALSSSGNGGSVLDRSPHPERFDPGRDANTLMYSEHWSRYCWASQVLAGKSVLDAGCGTGYGLEIMTEAGAAQITGVDIDPDAVAESRGRAERCGATAIEGDLRSLEFPDDSFDLAVCFETIEHLDAPERGLAELRRVLRPGGTMLVSSPNPDVYPKGNEHHLNELHPDQLQRLVREHFPCVRMYFQHPWLGSVIEPAEQGANGNGVAGHSMPVHRTGPPLSSGTTFTIVVGSDEERTSPSPLVSIGDSFEVRWWQERLAEAEEHIDQSLAETERALEAERRARQAEAQVEAASERLEQANSALIDANQELAQMPLLKHRLAEIYEQKAAAQALGDELLGSRSWQATAFLRRIGRILRLQR